MSGVAPVPSLSVPAIRRRPQLFGMALVVLLAAEVLGLTLRFDGYVLRNRQGWIAGLLGHSNLILSVGVCIATLVGSALWVSASGDRRRASAAVETGRRVWPLLAAHLAAYAALVGLSARVFDPAASSAHSLPWTIAWLTASLATLMLWLAAAAPECGWMALLKARWKLALCAVAGGIAAWSMARWTGSLWSQFHGSTFWSVRELLSLFHHDVVCMPERFVLGTSRFQVAVSNECSGFQGIGLIWAILAGYFFWFRHELRFPQVLLLLPIGTAASWSLNVLRIAALIAIGDRGWEDVAIGGFHSQAGWVTFNAIAIGLIGLSRRMPLFSRIDSPATTGNPTAAYVAPLLAIALTAMITGTVSSGAVDRLYAARVLAAAAVLWYYRRHYTRLLAWPSWTSLAIGAAVYAVWTALEPPPTSGAAMAVADMLAGMPRASAAVWLTARIMGSVLAVPLAEELAFRGFLSRRLIDADFESVPDGRFTWTAFLVSSLLFGLLHQRWIAGVIAGMAFALAYYRRGKLIDAVAAHATANLLITISVLLTGEWYRWS